MIYERFIVIFICSALSSLATNNSRATELDVQKSNFQDLATSQLNNYPAHHLAIAEVRIEAENKHKYKYNFPNYQQAANLAGNQNYLVAQTWQQKSRQQTEVPDNSINSEPLPEINRRWLWTAMAITSAMFIYLLWLLFRKPAHHQSAAKLTVVNQPEASNLTNQSECAQDEIITQTSSVLDTVGREKPISQDSKQITKISDIVEHENSQPESAGADNLAALNSLIKINSDSNPDYIDVVLELIKDLQHSDRNLKRKAIWELAKIGDSRSIEPLAKIMPQAGLVDKSLILKAITQITNRHFEPINDQLFALLKDQNPEVRTNAIRDLTALYKFVAPITKQLTQMQQDSDRRVRYVATQALQQLNSGSSLSSSDDNLNHENHHLTLREKKQSPTHHIEPSRN
ncbi:MAG: HEAT repeat domain-containing protein [Pleurocapsa sp.]